MSAILDGGPAFPVPLNEGQSWQGMEPCDGMSLRDYFAAKAMQGLMTMDGVRVGDDGMQIPKHAGIIAEVAYQTADAMLKARKQTGGTP